MIEARVDEAQRHDLPAEDPGDFAAAVADGSESRAREDHVAHEQEVALALLHLDRLDHVEAVAGEPVHEGPLLASALVDAEAHSERRAVDDEPAGWRCRPCREGPGRGR